MAPTSSLLDMSVGDPAGALLGVVALLLLVRTRLSASWLLLGGALLGVLRGGLL